MTEQRTIEQRLSEYLARKIFEAPWPRATVSRIAFRGVPVDGIEPDLGGLCETALADRIREAMEKYPW
jgi:hypothetical protein